MPFFCRKFCVFFVVLVSSLFYVEVLGQSQEADSSFIEMDEKQSVEQLLNQTKLNTEPVREVSFTDIESKYNTDDFDYTQQKQSNVFFSFIYKIYIWLLDFFSFTPDNSLNYLQRIISVIVFLVVLFVCIKLIIQYKGRWFFDKSDPKLQEINSEIEKNIHLVDFKELIHKYEMQNNTRQSIRLYYLWLLKTLSDKNIIQWSVQKTNSDYFREIKDLTLKQEFAKLSYLYNYIWYGEFQIQELDYQSAKADFEKYIHSK